MTTLLVTDLAEWAWESFMTHGTLGTFPTTLILFPPCFLLSFQERSLNSLSFFDFDREPLLSLDFRNYIPALTYFTVPVSRRFA